MQLRNLKVKTALFSAVATVGLLISAVPITRAQDASASQGQSVYHRRTPDEVVAALDSKLSLNSDQKAKIKPIIAERQEKMQALADSGGRRMKKAREMKSIMKDSDKKIKAVLNEDQQKKYAEIKQEMREQAKQRRDEHNRQD
jgi:periplasmic protein CpxP/Spy